VQPGSFFTDQLPAADCYLLSNIIHDWADDEALAILRAVRAAAPQDATLLLFEFVVPDDADEFEASDIDLWMLSLVGGRERTLDEYADLLQQAGWRLTRAVPTEVQTIIEAMPS
jgi:nucleotide-binding universal stress UspA family protein